jgi:hypothetical protein
MTNLPERLIQPWRRAALVLLLALLAACGPGTGGTGIGPVSFSGTFAAGSAGTADVGAIAAPGLPCSTCTRVDLRLDDGQVELRVPCGRFVFAGDWNPDATELVLAGTFERTRADGIVSLPATLRLQFGAEGVAGSRQVAMTLVDAAGVPLAVATLQRGEGVAAPDTCTP